MYTSLEETTYDGKDHGAISNEVVVEARQVCASTREEFDGSLDIKADSICTLYAVQNLLLLLFQDFLMRSVVLANGSGRIDGSQGRDVVERGIVI